MKAPKAIENNAMTLKSLSPDKISRSNDVRFRTFGHTASLVIQDKKIMQAHQNAQLRRTMDTNDFMQH